MAHPFAFGEECPKRAAIVKRDSAFPAIFYGGTIHPPIIIFGIFRIEVDFCVYILYNVHTKESEVRKCHPEQGDRPMIRKKTE